MTLTKKKIISGLVALTSTTAPVVGAMGNSASVYAATQKKTKPKKLVITSRQYVIRNEGRQAGTISVKFGYNNDPSIKPYIGTFVKGSSGYKQYKQQMKSYVNVMKQYYQKDAKKSVQNFASYSPLDFHLNNVSWAQVNVRGSSVTSYKIRYYGAVNFDDTAERTYYPNGIVRENTLLAH